MSQPPGSTVRSSLLLGGRLGSGVPALSEKGSPRIDGVGGWHEWRVHTASSDYSSVLRIGVSPLRGTAEPERLQGGPSTERNPSPRKLSVGGRFGKLKSNGRGQTTPRDSQSRSHSPRCCQSGWSRVPDQKEAFWGSLHGGNPMRVLSSGRSAGLSQSRRLIAQLAPRSLTFEEAL